MKDFEPSTLWRISAFEQARNSGRLGAGQDDRPTLLPTTLLADLQQLHKDPANNDVLEVIAACVRNREAALLYLEHGQQRLAGDDLPARGGLPLAARGVADGRRRDVDAARASAPSRRA